MSEAAGAADGSSEVEPAGHFRIYLGAAPGVGKTYAMLGEAQRRREQGADVVGGFVEAYGRPHTEELIGDLDAEGQAALAASRARMVTTARQPAGGGNQSARGASDHRCEWRWHDSRRSLTGKR